MKKRALPYFPRGFCRFGDPLVAAGLKDGDRRWLAVWCMGEETHAEIELDVEIKQAKIAYPSAPNATLSASGSRLTLDFARPQTACFLEIN